MYLYNRINEKLFEVKCKEAGGSREGGEIWMVLSRRHILLNEAD